MLDCGTCSSTQHLCFGVAGHYTLWNTKSNFMANLASLLGDGCRKLRQSVITDFIKHNTGVFLICRQKSLADLTAHVVFLRKFR